tara:strand:- start:337 stop:693 length:357 start_codon:yes stop_codon:yes gene_type:complete
LLGQGKSLKDINPGDDTDGDGMSNIDEYISGNYAFDKDDGLRLDIVKKQENGTVLEFMGIQGRTYTIQGSPNLKSWSACHFNSRVLRVNWNMSVPKRFSSFASWCLNQNRAHRAAFLN